MTTEKFDRALYPVASSLPGVSKHLLGRPQILTARRGFTETNTFA